LKIKFLKTTLALISASSHQPTEPPTAGAPRLFGCTVTCVRSLHCSQKKTNGQGETNYKLVERGRKGAKKYCHLIKKTVWKRFGPVKVLTFKHCCSGSNVCLVGDERAGAERLAKTVEPVQDSAQCSGTGRNSEPGPGCSNVGRCPLQE
jgi:hypothetical protein